MRQSSNIADTASSWGSEKQASSQIKKPESVLNQFDLKPIKDVDPILAAGYKDIFALRLPFLLKFLAKAGESQNAATIEYLNIRLLTKSKNTASRVDKFTIEVTSENDLFFYFFHTLDPEGYELLKQRQQLEGSFLQYFASTQSYLEKCNTEPQRFACILSIKPDQTGCLQIIQTLNYKDIEVLRYDMIAGDEGIIRQHVSYKYGAKRSCLNLVDGRIKDVNELVKLKNPQLLLHIQKILETNSKAQQQSNIVQNQAINKQYASLITTSHVYDGTAKKY